MAKSREDLRKLILAMNPDAEQVEEAVAAAPRVPRTLGAVGSGFYEANIKPLLTPKETAMAILGLGREMVRAPGETTRGIARSELERLQGAGKSPEAAAEYYGGMLSPFSMLRRAPTMQEIKAYHGSPTQFEPTAESILGEFDMAKAGKRSFSGNPQTRTPEFKRFFANSKAVDESGNPKVYYHGTMKDFDEFKSTNVFLSSRFGPRIAERIAREGSLFFVSPDPRFASRFAINDMLSFDPRPEDQTLEWAERVISNVQAKPFGGQSNVPNVMPLYVRAENPFDFSNPSHWKKAEKAIRKELLDTGGYTSKEVKNTIDQAKRGKWTFLEDIHSATNAFRKLGFDSIYVEEAGVRNLAVFDPAQLKSAVGNVGSFDTRSPVITKAHGGEVRPLAKDN